MGFDLVGITQAEPPKMIGRYQKWLDKGYAGKMDYLKRHLNLKRDPKTILSEAKSVICVGMNYYTIEPDPARKVDPLRGQISRYAWGDDYHDIIRAKLKKLVKIIARVPLGCSSSPKAGLGASQPPISEARSGLPDLPKELLLMTNHLKKLKS